MGAQYYDARWVKKAITRLWCSCVVETLGGIAPPTKQFLHVFAEEAVGGGAQQYRTAVAAALKLVYVLKLVYARVAL